MIQITLVEEKTNLNGFGFALWRKYRNFQTWYSIETWGPNDRQTIINEYHDMEKAFDVVESLERKLGLQ